MRAFLGWPCGIGFPSGNSTGLVGGRYLFAAYQWGKPQVPLAGQCGGPPAHRAYALERARLPRR